MNIPAARVSTAYEISFGPPFECFAQNDSNANAYITLAHLTRAYHNYFVMFRFSCGGVLISSERDFKCTTSPNAFCTSIYSASVMQRVILLQEVQAVDRRSGISRTLVIFMLFVTCII